jgi:hypothetical protein
MQAHTLRNLGNRTDLATLIKEWINSCYIDLVTTGKFPELDRFAPIPVPALEVYDTFTTLVGRDYYAYPTDALYIIALRDTTNNMPLKKRDMLWLERNKSTTNAKPLIYATYGNTIWVDPPPDGIYTIRRLYRKKVDASPLVNDNDVPIVAAHWHEALEIGATYRGKRSIGDPTADRWLQDLKAFIISHSEQQTEEEEDFDGGFRIVL